MSDETNGTNYFLSFTIKQWAYVMKSTPESEPLQSGGGAITAEDAYHKDALRSLNKIAREVDSGVEPTFNDSGEYEKYNREVENKIERLRDRVQFGSNLEKVIMLDGTECPWSQGVEPFGSEDNPDNVADKNRTMWRNVDRAGFQQCNSQRIDEGDASYNKVFRTADDPNPRYLMTKHPRMPYCVRCDVPKTVKRNFADMVKAIEDLADTITASARKKAYEKNQKLIADLEDKRRKWNELYNQIYWGDNVSQFKVPATGCMDHAATAKLWQDPSKVRKGSINQDETEEIEDPETGKTRLVWKRPYAVKDPASGELYCATGTDENVINDPHYHGLAALEKARIENPAAWPTDPETNKPMSVAEVYNRSAFCAQLSQPNGETVCQSATSKSAPLGKTLVPMDACQWHPNFVTGGECAPQDVLMGEDGTVKDSTPYSKWYKEWAPKERSIASNPSNATSDFPKQRFMIPYTVPLPRGGGADKISAGGKKRAHRRHRSSK